ncbi:MAG TPA: hypothetical protein VGO59_08840 [Verrucomicrobiae bacterium]
MKPVPAAPGRPQPDENLPAPPMRVLLRNVKTMKFVRSGKRWTADPRQATDFHNGWGAATHASTLPLRRMVIHYEFKDTRYNLNIPILSRAPARH